MRAHGQLGCVLTVDEVAEGVEIKGTELEGTDMRMIRVRPLIWCTCTTLSLSVDAHAFGVSHCLMIDCTGEIV